MSSSSSYSLVSDLIDLENGFEIQYKKALAELEASKKRNEALEASIQELKEKMEKLEVDEENILTSIVGSWSLVSSIGMEEFIQKWAPSKMDNALFQVGSLSYECDGDNVTESWAIGTCEHWRRTQMIGETKYLTKLLIDNNMLVSVYFLESGEEYARVEKSVKNGQLTMVTKRFGMKCTRVYEKVGTEKKMGLEAARRIAELESELEKLRSEKCEEEKQFTAALVKKTEEIEELDSELEELNEELEALEVEKATVEKELQEARKDSLEAFEYLGRQSNISMNMMQEVRIQMKDKEVLKERLKETEEMLRVEKSNVKMELEEKTKKIEELSEKLKVVENENEVMNEEFDEMFGELDALKEEKANVEEELKKEKEGTDEISRKLKMQTDMVMDMRNKVEILLEEKEALRKRLTETVEKLETANSLLRSTDVEDKVGPASLKSAIVGTWQNPLNSKETTVLRLNDVILTETTTTASTESYCKDWVLNNPNFEFSAQSYAHTFFENNQLITIISKKATGEECWIKRTLKDGQLRVVMTKGKESIPSVDITYEKVKLNVNVC